MSCCSNNICSTRNFSSSSVALPRNRCSFSTAACHWGGGMGHHGLGYFSSRSLDGMTCSRPRIAVGRGHPPRSGYGFGAAGTEFGYRVAGFSYRVGGVSRPCTITPITINEQLLQPLRLELDPNMQTVKYQEKEQIKTLNNEFASFIDKVLFLGQQNKMLETKWSLLQGRNHRKDSCMPMFQSDIGILKQQLEALGCNKAQLETDLKAAQQVLDNKKKMYKDERSQQTGTESEFIALKKDVDCFSSNKAELEAQMESLKEAAEFLRMFYDEEIQQLQAQISDTLEVMKMDNSQYLNLDGSAVDIKAQYEDIDRRSRAEAQAWCKSKFEELRVTADRNADNLRDTKKKRAELARIAQRRKGEVRSTKEQLEATVADAERRGENSIKDAKHKLSKLETALQQTKADLTHQLCEYQELIDIKLALDTEMSPMGSCWRERRAGSMGKPPSAQTALLAIHRKVSPTAQSLPLDVSVHRRQKLVLEQQHGSLRHCGEGVSSRSARSSHTKVVSVTEFTRATCKELQVNAKAGNKATPPTLPCEPTVSAQPETVDTQLP